MCNRRNGGSRQSEAHLSRVCVDALPTDVRRQPCRRKPADFAEKPEQFALVGFRTARFSHLNSRQQRSAQFSSSIHKSVRHRDAQKRQKTHLCLPQKSRRIHREVLLRREIEPFPAPAKRAFLPQTDRADVLLTDNADRSKILLHSTAGKPERCSSEMTKASACRALVSICSISALIVCFSRARSYL